jgi:hypothetical protein
VGNRLYESLGSVAMFKEHSWIKQLT